MAPMAVKKIDTFIIWDSGFLDLPEHKDQVMVKEGLK